MKITKESLERDGYLSSFAALASYAQLDIPALLAEVKRLRTPAIERLLAERQRQDEKWGDQSGNHPFEWMSILGEEFGELCEAVNETCFGNATNPEKGGHEKMLTEASHVAAVAVAIMESVINRMPLPEPPEGE